MVLVTVPWAMSAAARTQNPGSRVAALATARRRMWSGRCKWVGAGAGGGLRTMKACSGTITAPWTASASSAPRQPRCATSRPVRGMKTVLASPATTVIASRAVEVGWE